MTMPPPSSTASQHRSVLGCGATPSSGSRPPTTSGQPDPSWSASPCDVEIWLWVEDRRDVLRFDLTSFQVGHAALLAEELDLVVGSLDHAQT